MRHVIRGLLFIIAAGAVCGCSGMSAKCVAPVTTQADKAADTKACVMQSRGADVLKLTLAHDAKCVATDGFLHVSAPQYEVEVWLAPGVQTVDEGIARSGPQIVDEFKDFKPDQTTDLTIAGSPAKQLVGTGHEADDGDPGSADLIVFKLGDHMFIACYHGESITPAGQQGMLALLETAQIP